MVLWLCFRLIAHVFVDLNSHSGEALFAYFEHEASKIHEMSCNQDDVLLAHYPAGTYSYWFTEMAPVSKYVFMWPWVADVGLEDVIKELSQSQIRAVVIIHFQHTKTGMT